METIQKLDKDTLSRHHILRKAKYRCSVCQGINHKEGYYNASGMFIECDTHMREWAIKQGLKLIRISLQIIEAPPSIIGKHVIKHLVLCRRHHMEHKNLMRSFLKKSK